MYPVHTQLRNFTLEYNNAKKHAGSITYECNDTGQPEELQAVQRT
jgi:hypothetical protein